MTNEEILEKALQKAIKNNYRHDIVKIHKGKYILERFVSNILDWTNRKNTYFRLIFSHDFVKAFWGEEILCNECGKLADDCDLHIWEHYKIAWQYHIQQMAIMKEPLKYLEKFL